MKTPTTIDFENGGAQSPLQISSFPNYAPPYLELEQDNDVIHIPLSHLSAVAEAIVSYAPEEGA